jgi:hypothetical protein
MKNGFIVLARYLISIPVPRVVAVSSPRDKGVGGRGRFSMSDKRSPCLHCKRLDEDKEECARFCEELDRYREELPYGVLSGEDLSDYHIPGVARTPSYRNSF